MATTVFPLTDRTVTVAAWASMVSSINRGEDDPLAGTTSESYSGPEITWNRVGGLIADQTDTTSDEIITFPVTLGDTVEGRVHFAVDRVDNGGVGPMDNYHVRLSVPSGVRVVGVAESVANFSTLITGAMGGFDLTNQEQDVLIIYASGPWSEQAAIFIDFIAFGEAAGGTVSIQARKGSDLDVDDYRTSDASVMTHRIRG